MVQNGADVRSARAPVVTDQRVTVEPQGGGEIDAILPQCHELAAAKRVVTQEARAPLAAQPRDVRAKARVVERWQHTIPPSHVVGPAVKRDDRET